MQVISEKVERIHPDTGMGRVHYTVADLDAQVAFYRDILGFHLRWRDADGASLGTRSRELLRLTRQPGARRVHRTTGLYHTAFLVPTRWDLAHLVRRIAEARVPVDGTSDHGTHLAIYLPDAEGNGIELAWDFPKEQWPIKDGQWDLSAMPRRGVNLPELMDELRRDDAPWEGLPEETRVGHVHLHVSDLDRSQWFYCDVLGFDVMLRHDRWGAMFVSAGGYHHHLGLNVWLGVGAPPAPEGSLGLRNLAVELPHEEARQQVLQRIREAGLSLQEDPEGVLVYDPSRIGVLLTVRAGS